MASFDGATFLERRDGTQFRRWESTAILIKTHYPGGNRNTIQNLGRSARTVTVLALCTESELNALYTKAGEVGLLVWSWTTSTAVLESVRAAEVMASGEHFVELSFTEVT